MVRKMEAVNLAKWVSKGGPHVIFFNSESPGENSELIQYMHEMYNKLKYIKFYELNWSDYKKFKNIPTDDGINSVLIYFDGVLVLSEFNPQAGNLIQFFNKCVELHNQKIDEAINNVGSRTKNNRKGSPPKETDLLSVIKRKEQIYRKAYLLGKKIKISFNKKKLTESSNWFCDVKFYDLPTDLLDENLISDYSQKSNNNSDLMEDKLYEDINVEKMLKKAEIKNYLYNKETIKNEEKLKYKKIIIYDKSWECNGTSKITYSGSKINIINPKDISLNTKKTKNYESDLKYQNHEVKNSQNQVIEKVVKTKIKNKSLSDNNRCNKLVKKYKNAFKEYSEKSFQPGTKRLIYFLRDSNGSLKLKISRKKAEKTHSCLNNYLDHTYCKSIEKTKIRKYT